MVYARQFSHTIALITINPDKSEMLGKIVTLQRKLLNIYTMELCLLIYVHCLGVSGNSSYVTLQNAFL